MQVTGMRCAAGYQENSRASTSVRTIHYRQSTMVLRNLVGRRDAHTVRINGCGTVFRLDDPAHLLTRVAGHLADVLLGHAVPRSLPDRLGKFLPKDLDPGLGLSESAGQVSQ